MNFLGAGTILFYFYIVLSIAVRFASVLLCGTLLDRKSIENFCMVTKFVLEDDSERGSEAGIFTRLENWGELTVNRSQKLQTCHF